MNFCPNCGAKLGKGANFCSNCGANLKKYEVQSENDTLKEPSQNSENIKTHKEISQVSNSEAGGMPAKILDITESATAPSSSSNLNDVNEINSDEENLGEPGVMPQVEINNSVEEQTILQTGESVRDSETDKLPQLKSNEELKAVAAPQQSETANTPRLKKTIPDDSKRLERLLRAQLTALYIQLTMTFHIQMGTGNLATKFSRIKLKISRKIAGYDLDEIANRVEPLCSPEHEATQTDLDFVEGLVKKYQNYDRPSELVQKLNYLSGQSSNAIVDAENLNDLQEYLHVNRGNLEKDFLRKLQRLTPNQGKLIFLVGNVGDGKSHLIGHLKKKYESLFEEKQIKIHYDATESFDPKKTAIETLLDVLSPFMDEKLDYSTTNLIVAINMGILMNFLRQAERNGHFKKLIEFLRKTGITTSRTQADNLQAENFELISFRDYPLFTIDDTGTTSKFYDDLFERIVSPESSNPFYLAYKEDKEHFVMRLTHHNFELFTNPKVRETLKFLLIKIQIESKVIISTRALLELIHDILVPSRLEESEVITYHDSLPYLLFGGTGDSLIIKKINQHDPQEFQNLEVEELLTRVYNSHKNLQELAVNFLGEEDAQSITWLWDYIQDVHKTSFDDKIGLLLRMKYLLNRDATIFNDSFYYQYLALLSSLQKADENREEIHNFYKMTKEFIYRWNGSPQNNYIFTFINEREKFGVAVPFNLVFEGIQEQDFDVVFKLKNVDAEKTYSLVIDYDLFVLINKVNRGYILKEEDRHQFVNVATFVENIIKSGQAKKETLIGNIETNKFYRLTYDGMDIEMGEMK